MSKLQKHIWTFIETDFNPDKTNFNKAIAQAQAELGPAKPQLVGFIIDLMILLLLSHGIEDWCLG